MLMSVIKVRRMDELYNNQRGLQIPLASLYSENEASRTNLVLNWQVDRRSCVETLRSADTRSSPIG